MVGTAVIAAVIILAIATMASIAAEKILGAATS